MSEPTDKEKLAAALDVIRCIENIPEVGQCLYDGDTCGAVEAALDELNGEIADIERKLDTLRSGKALPRE